MIQDALKKVMAGESLTRQEASVTMDQIMTGQATPAQIAGLLVALKLTGETSEMVAGFVESMREHSVRVAIDDPNAVDGCGTGGDGSGSFNISTAAALVAASAGVTVAKHGNRSVSSACGSADLLEALGANLDPGPERVAASVNEIGFGFMFAPSFHPAMKYAVEPRRDLGVRTVFNILGPMTNPAGVKNQVIGVYDDTLMPLIGEVLSLTGSRHVLLVRSADGLDEFSVCAPNEFVTFFEGNRDNGTIAPEDVGLRRYPSGATRGGNASRNAQILHEVFKGERSAFRDAVAFNAGALLYVGDKCGSVADGVALALDAIDTGAATEKLSSWIEFTRRSA